MKIKHSLIIGIFAMLFIFAGCQKNTNSEFWKTNQASKHCIDNNGSIEVRKYDNGTQYAVCTIKEKECKEWDYYNGLCHIVYDFKTCIGAGNPILKSNPAQCVHETITYTEDLNKNQQESACNFYGGSFIEEHNECLGISKVQCNEMSGFFNECASACRHNKDENTVCTLQCVQVCQLK